MVIGDLWRPKKPSRLEIYNGFVYVDVCGACKCVVECELGHLASFDHDVQYCEHVLSLTDAQRGTKFSDTLRSILIPNTLLVAIAYWVGVFVAPPFRRETFWIELGEHGVFILVFVGEWYLEKKHFPNTSQSTVSAKPLIGFHLVYAAFLFGTKLVTDVDLQIAGN
mmetsp:Transcript_21615/g.30219  ORF Transcript_21615/g.30219 Transcript_21615/m.30219 type:complete len:166 (+) Transcript_21615:527-1024(+)